MTIRHDPFILAGDNQLVAVGFKVAYKKVKIPKKKQALIYVHEKYLKLLKK